MKRKYLCLLLLPVLLLLLAGCHAAQPMEITVLDPPGGAQFTVMLRADAGDEITPTESASETDLPETTAVEQDAENDGWYRADRLARSTYTRWENGSILLYYRGSSSKYQLLEFCEQAGSIRIAELDENGCLCGISDEIDVAYAGKMYVPYRFTYDYNTGETVLTDGVYRDWNGKPMKNWFLEAVLVTQIAGILLLTAGCICTVIRNIRRRLTVQWILFACMSVPYLLTTALYLMLRLSPKYTWDTALTASDAILLLCNSLLWIIALTALTVETVILEKKGMQYESH